MLIAGVDVELRAVTVLGTAFILTICSLAARMLATVHAKHEAGEGECDLRGERAGQRAEHGGRLAGEQLGCLGGHQYRGAAVGQ